MIPDAIPKNEEAINFMQAIRADLDDNLPRLVFADYLEETGYSDYATYIRVECEMSSGCVSVELCTTALRIRQSMPRYKSWQATYRRGFIEEVRCSLDAWERVYKPLAWCNCYKKVSILDVKPLHAPGGWYLPLWKLPLKVVRLLIAALYTTQQEAEDDLSQAIIADALGVLRLRNTEPPEPEVGGDEAVSSSPGDENHVLCLHGAEDEEDSDMAPVQPVPVS